MKIFKYFTALFLFAFILSCVELIEDCLFWPHRAQVETGSIENGVVNQEFNRVIQCGTENSTLDDQYTYEIYIEGDLPDGLSYTTTGRILTIEGTPTETGTFDIEVFVTIINPPEVDDDEYSDNGRICGDTNTTSKEFTFTIARS